MNKRSVIIFVMLLAVNQLFAQVVKSSRESSGRWLPTSL